MAHCNTIFHQMLKLIPRHHFGKLAAEHGTGRKARSFTRWSQLVHLLSMQLTARVSLRDGVSSLKARIKSLYLSLYPWASFRRTKGGIKLHTLLDHDGYLPAFVAVSPAREPEIKKARSLSLPKGSIVVGGRGYTD